MLDNETYELELTKAKERAEVSEAKFINSFQQSIIGFAITSPDKKWIEVNDAMCNFLEYSREELFQMTWTELTHPEDLESDISLFNKLIKGDIDSYKIEKRYLTKSGKVFYAELSVRCNFNSSYEPEYFLALVYDITERKQLEFELIKAKERAETSECQFKTIFNSTGTSNSIFDEKGVLILQNQASIEDYGGEVVGLNVYEIFGDSLGEIILKRIHNVLKTSKMETYETEFDLPTGKNWYRSTYIPFDVLEKKLVHVVSQNITEKKLNQIEFTKAKERAEESEANFQNFFNSIQDMLIVSDYYGNVIYANDIIITKLGYTEEELKKIGLLNLHPIEYRTEAEEIFKKMLQGQQENCPLPVQKKNGDFIQVETRIYLGNWSGKECIFGIIRDLTLEQEAEQRFERIFRNNPALMALTYNEEFIDVNNTFLKTLGYELEEIIGQNSAKINIALDKESQRKAAEKLKTEGRFTELEMKVRCKNGNELTGLFSGEEIFYNNKRCFITVMTDITERKKAENELFELNIELTKAKEKSEESEAKLKLSQEIAKIGSWELDLDTLMFSFNDNFYKIFHTNIEQIGSYKMSIDEYANNFLHPDDVHLVAEATKLAIESTEKNFEGYIEHRIKYFNEGFGYVAVKFYIYKDNTGKPIKTYGVNQDITEQKKAENELFELNIELTKAKEKAEESDKLKTAFLQNMSHEIRTPLNGILGFSNLLQYDNISNDDIKEFTSYIKSGAERLLETMNNIIDVSKLETNQMIVKEDYFSLNDLITDQFNHYNSVAIQKGLEFIYFYELDESDSYIMSDISKISQILSNLISNAIKFTNKGSISFGYKVIDGDVVFSVSDTGVGIAEEYHQNIYDSFVQADNSLNRGFEGSGLGLAICKGLTTLLDGEIWFETKLNLGTTFYLKIKRNQNKLLDNEVLNKKENTKRTRTILVAEDDISSYRYFDVLLRNWGYKVLIAENGNQAFEIVKQTPDISLILMDIKMPELNGILSAKKIREYNSDIVIVAQTAYATTNDKDFLLESGFDAYISKPVDKQELKLLLEKYIKS